MLSREYKPSNIQKMGTEATLLAFSSSLGKFSWNRLWGTFCSSRRRGRCDCRPRQNCAIVESSVRGEESGTRISGSFASANRLHSLARGVPKVDVKRTSGTTVSNSTRDAPWKPWTGMAWGWARVNVNRRNESLSRLPPW